MALTLLAGVARAATSGGADLIGVRVGGDAASTRVVLDLNGPVTAAPVPSQSGLVLSLSALRAHQTASGTGRGLVTAWRLREEAAGARLYLVTPAGATIARRFLIPASADGAPWRYVVDIQDPDPLSALAAEFPEGAARPRPPAAAMVVARAEAAIKPPGEGAAPIVPPRGVEAPPTPGLDGPGGPRIDAPPSTPPPALPSRHVLAAARPPFPRVPGARGAWVVVIDAGHGGHDPGARSLVRNEKDITLAAALSLKARLEAMGRYKVVLTRDRDVFIPLEARVQIARRAGADLFISLHADSAGSDPTPHGASVYTLSDHGETRVNTVLGPHEWFSQAGGLKTEPGVGRILLDLTQRSTRNRSSRFAGLLIEHIGDRIDLLPRSHRDAGYFVLLAPDVPAVLLEMGFITNPADEMRLTDPAQRDRLVVGVADAIDAFFSGDTRLAAD
jgi:N-acetylmuramoyl-L-alanine amidase